MKTTKAPVHLGEERLIVQVAGAFFGIEAKGHEDQVEVGKPGTRQIADTQLIDDGANQRPEPLQGRVMRWSRGKPQAALGDAHLQNLVADSDAEVMHFVHDEQVEAVTDGVHVPVGAFEGRHGDRLDPVAAVSQAADAAAIDSGQLQHPLLKQCARRHQAQGPATRARHGCERHASLPAPGGHD
jgi:hypothetical protein